MQTVITRMLAALVLTAALVTVTAEPAHAAGGLTCRYTPIQWSGGFSADLTIRNDTATTINGWSAYWNFQNPTRVTTTWNGSITQGTLLDATARNSVYNGVIRPGGASTLGWTATASAADVPTAVIVNGQLCPVSS